MLDALPGRIERPDAVVRHRRAVVDQEINAGRLVSKKLGNARLIPIAEIIKWLEKSW
jgi:hypothetical protein